ncbi:hypothetical protein TNIN_273521 [Trichonephila inaurata madagascariensis]|uniref:Uncharacterized protein n=1 Tax=Trichonephila inaurata madagascariensis TaxID=2747483 RepID=A0A8X6YI12_9ARAC|nr:hypothetical protein TNIN_273521 [Trichonephila inaurata madagascariensis]
MLLPLRSMARFQERRDLNFYGFESYTLLSTSQYNLCDCRQRLIVAKCGGFTAQHPFIPIQFSGNPVTSPAIVAFPNAEAGNRLYSRTLHSAVCRTPDRIL